MHFTDDIRNEVPMARTEALAVSTGLQVYYLRAGGSQYRGAVRRPFV
jgi:hypothetical protein